MIDEKLLKKSCLVTASGLGLSPHGAIVTQYRTHTEDKEEVRLLETKLASRISRIVDTINLHNSSN